jgi:hypothetical protein
LHAELSLLTFLPFQWSSPSLVAELPTGKIDIRDGGEAFCQRDITGSSYIDINISTLLSDPASAPVVRKFIPVDDPGKTILS